MRKLTTEEFIQRAKEIHCDKYDYSNVEYKNTATKVKLLCNICGNYFYSTPNSILRGNGCPYCAGVARSNTEEFIEKARKTHGNKYDYSKVEYINAHTKVHIICPKHVEFLQKPNCHLSGNGCKLCGVESCHTKELLGKDKFIHLANIKHNFKYDYSKVKYIGIDKKVQIACPIHGYFWQTPSNHLQGCGCKECGRIKLKRILCNVGINDCGNDVFDKNTGRGKKFYETWANMIRRCYDEKMWNKIPTYRDCEVCKTWHRLSNFRKFYEEHYVEGYELDKDLLYKGNKIYSPNTCVFLPHEINSFLANKYTNRGKYPTGVTWRERNKKWQARITTEGKQHSLGMFLNIEDALYAYKIAREKEAKRLAEKYKNSIENRAYDALINYE